MTVYLHKNLLRQLDMIETTGASQQLSGQIVGGERVVSRTRKAGQGKSQ